MVSLESPVIMVARLFSFYGPSAQLPRGARHISTVSVTTRVKMCMLEG